jgi:hypothetical protein
MRQLLKTKLVDMDLSVRALNCLKAADVETLGDLVSYAKSDLLKFRNFGKKSLTELEDLVDKEPDGLCFRIRHTHRSVRHVHVRSNKEHRVVSVPQPISNYAEHGSFTHTGRSDKANGASGTEVNDHFRCTEQGDLGETCEDVSSHDAKFP